MEFIRGATNSNLFLCFKPVKKMRCPSTITRSKQKTQKLICEFMQFGELKNLSAEGNMRYIRPIGRFSQIDICSIRTKSKYTEFFVAYKFYPYRQRLIQNLEIFTELTPTTAHRLVSEHQTVYRALLDPRLDAHSLIEAAEEVERTLLSSIFTHVHFEEIKNIREELFTLLKSIPLSCPEPSKFTIEECVGMLASYFEVILSSDFGNFFTILADNVL